MNAAWPVIASEWDDAVCGFLRANPGWLASHPELYRLLTPPARVHGDAMADHMAAMLRLERSHAEAMTGQAEAILAAGRANAAMFARVQEAVLALMAAPDATDLVAGDLARLLGADAVCLCSRHPPHDQHAGEIDRLQEMLGQRAVLFRLDPDDAASLYAEAAPLALHDVLIRIPGAGVLAIASRDPMCAEQAPAHAAFQFLGRAVAAALLRPEQR